MKRNNSQFVPLYIVVCDGQYLLTTTIRTQAERYLQTLTGLIAHIKEI